MFLKVPDEKESVVNLKKKHALQLRNYLKFLIRNFLFQCFLQNQLTYVCNIYFFHV